MEPVAQPDIDLPRTCIVSAAEGLAFVLGLADDTHPPAARFPDDPVMRNRLADYRKFSTSIRSLPD